MISQNERNLLGIPSNTLTLENERGKLNFCNNEYKPKFGSFEIRDRRNGDVFSVIRKLFSSEYTKPLFELRFSYKSAIKSLVKSILRTIKATE